MLHALIVLAEEGTKNPDSGAGSGPFSLLMFVPIAILAYLLLIRPMKKQEQERQAMAGNLKKNDEVLTSAGIYGTVVDISETDDKITVRVADSVRLKMTKGSVLRNLSNEEAAKQAKAAKEVKA